MDTAMPVTLLVAVTILSASLRGEQPQAVGSLREPPVVSEATYWAAQVDWQHLIASPKQTVAVTTRSRRQMNGQILSADADGLVVLSGDHGVRVDRKDICDVMTYQSAVGWKAKYAGDFAAVGAGIGVLSWLAKNIGDQQNTNLVKEVAIGGGVAALIGLAIERAQPASQPETLYRADNRLDCPAA